MQHNGLIANSTTAHMASTSNSSHFRCRLFVGNLADCDENEVRQLFQQYGQVLECSASKEKSYAFVKMVCG